MSVVKNEEIETEKENDEEEVTFDYDIASYPSDYTLAGLTQMWHDGDIEIPDYQREFVWSRKQSSLLIDSFLSGLPVPPVFFYIDESNKNLVIDGQQRILSVVFYMEGYFGKESTHGKRQVFRLTELGEKNPYNGKRFVDLKDGDQRKLKQAVLRAVNIRQLSPVGESTSAFHIFERLNTGGTPLKPQEIRNCVFRGKFMQLLKVANEDPNWRKIIGKPNLDKYQKDVEFILRVFSLVDSVDNYAKPMKEFLNKAMKTNQSGYTNKVEHFFRTFPIITEVIINQLGEKPFHLRRPLNVSALDSVMCVLIENYQLLPNIDLTDKYNTLQLNEKFVEWTSINTTDEKTVVDRMKLVKETLIG